MTKASSPSVAGSGLQWLMGTTLLVGLLVGWRTWHLQQTPAEVVLEQTVNPNQAEMALLVCLPGLGPKRARAIIDYRVQHDRGDDGPVFTCPEDLLVIQGIGPGILKQITPYLRFDPQPRSEGHPNH